MNASSLIVYDILSNFCDNAYAKNSFDLVMLSPVLYSGK